MKRIISKAVCLLCAGALALTAAGCSKSAASSSTSASSEASVYGSASDYDYQNFAYSDGLDENGYWSGIRALDYVTLPEDYASISLKKADIEPTEEDVQSQIDSLLSQNTTTQQITDRAAADGDTVNIDYVGTVDGVAFTGGTYSGYSLTLGSGSFIDGFEDQIVGHKPGETFEVNVTFPDGYSDSTDADGNEIAALTSESRLYGPGTGMFSEAFDEEILGMKKGQTKEFTLEVPEDETAVLLAGQAGKPVTFEVTCNVVKKKVTPEVTDEWAKEKMGFESVEDMRERIKESLNAQKGSLMPRIKENNIMVELRDRVEGDVPESLVEQAETSLLQDFFGQLQQAGMTFDAYLASQNITPDQFKADLKAQSADQVKEELALEAWARHNNMEITDADVTAEFAKTGVEDPAALEQEWRDAGRLHLIRTGLLRQKAIEDLMENANVTEVDFAAKKDEAEEAAE